MNICQKSIIKVIPCYVNNEHTNDFEECRNQYRKMSGIDIIFVISKSIFVGWFNLLNEYKCPLDLSKSSSNIKIEQKRFYSARCNMIMES